jgi:hypothetical protein
MGKLTKIVFNESCCDGGICNINENSMKPCGCDPGANHVCSYHTAFREGYEDGVLDGSFEAMKIMIPLLKAAEFLQSHGGEFDKSDREMISNALYVASEWIDGLK